MLAFLPLEEVHLGSPDRAILETLGIVPGQDQLHGGEEPLVKLGLLIRKTLTDTITDRDAAILKLQHTERDTVDVQDDIGTPLQIATKRDLLREPKSFLVGSSQLMRWTVSVTLPASTFTGTPYRKRL
jgi:hypothetical protein